VVDAVGAADEAVGGGGGGGGDEGGIAGGRGDPYPYPVPRGLGARGAFVSPGTYTVTLQAGDAKATETIRVNPDPLLQLTVVQHKEREGFQLEMADMLGEIVSMSQQLATLRKDLTAKRDGAAEGSAARTAADSSLARLTGVERSFVTSLGAAQGRINQLYGSFNGSGAQQGSLYPPTAPMKAQARDIRAAIDRVKREMAVVSRP
jgi:hypothetical protein